MRTCLPRSPCSRFRVIAPGLANWRSDVEVGKYIYRNCICTHLDSDLDKFNLLVYMTRKLFDFAKGKCAPENQDSPMFQEVLLGGHLYQMILKSKFEQYLYILRQVIENQAANNKGGPERYKLTPEYTIATGNIDARHSHGLLQTSGLTVVADKFNFMRFVSHFRVVHRGAFFGQMRTTGVRKLLPEAWGFLCPAHTPDSSPCGLMNHAAALCKFQVFTMASETLVNILHSVGVSSLSNTPCPVKQCYHVLLDGSIVGYVIQDMAETLVQKLRVMKVKGLNKVPGTMEICLVKKTQFASQYPGVYLFTTPARMVRPVKNLALDMVEMIGTFEQVYMDICITQNEAYEGVTTHQELDDVSMLSFAANLTPFSDFNQSPRNMYQCQMGKQTMGVPCHTLQYRADNKLYKIQTPQTPMVRPTKYDDYQMDDYPLGMNAIVAVISYTGYDMEDAMVINKGSYQRGFGHASVYKSDMVNLCNKQSMGRDKTMLTFGCKPNSDVYLKGQLDLDGLPPVGTFLTEGCPYYSYINTHTGEEKIQRYKSSEPAWVEHIKLLGNDFGTNMNYKVAFMLRIDRNPIIGDKFASRHGQKGVCSMMYPVEDMPFTESGMTPDIIFNPHGYPSRMTIGMMIESMAGKSAATFGDCYDATPFQFSEDDSAIDYFGNMLVKAGYNYYGTERFYSGVDGREMEANIFMGVVYYQKLRHMVSDKFQVRTTGPIDPMTCQPIKGRKRHGGVRFGEMERDALISHGTSFLLQDRLFNCSDKTMNLEPVEFSLPNGDQIYLKLEDVIMGSPRIPDKAVSPRTAKVYPVEVPGTMEICLVKKTQFASQYPGVYLFTTPARMVRPVKNLALDMVEMVGTFEQVYMDICITQNEAYEGKVTTHQELDDVSMLSFAANLTPFSDFNQSPRNMYQCQMGKQTMGVPCHTLQYRADNKLYKIQTPQTPMVRPTKYDDYQMDDYPLGMNAIVAVISYTGYDMEDAMVINKGSYQRGFGHASVYKSDMVNLCNKQSMGRDKTMLTFGCKPNSDVYMKGQLDLDGLPPVGTFLTEGCPYFSYINTHTGEEKIQRYKSSEPAWVEHIKLLGNDFGTNMNYKVAFMLRIDRNPIIGDKFASRHGQKGVCSMMYPVEDMPFTESGMTPDIIFNPHGYPSRMTIGMMIESMAGKSAATFGDCYDATPFQFSEDDSAIDYFGNMLVKAGYNYYGTERFYSGVDGREMEANIFMGVVYYQKLRHMVSDKFQVRTTGPIDPMTCQPIKGRKRHGGVRFGEMERDALISHGTSFLLQDRLFNCSDKTMAPVCTKCGNILSVYTEKLSSVEGKEKQRYFVCALCKGRDNVQIIAVPFVFKYLVVELSAMNIRVDLDVKELTD